MVWASRIGVLPAQNGHARTMGIDQCAPWARRVQDGSLLVDRQYVDDDRLTPLLLDGLIAR